MDVIVIIALLVLLSNVIAAVAAMRSKLYKKDVKTLLVVLYISFAFWGGTQIFNYFPISEEINIVSVRLGYTFIGSANLALVYFIDALESTHIKLKLRKYFFAWLCLLLIITVSPLIVKNISIEDSAITATNSFIFILMFGLGNVAIFTTSIINLSKKINSIRNLSMKANLEYFRYSLILAVIAVIIFNLVVPNIINTNVKDSPLIGYSSLFFFTISSIYVFNSKRFYSLKYLLTRGLYFIISGSFAYIIFHLVLWIQIELWGDVYKPVALTTGYLYALIFILLLRILDTKLRIWLERKSRFYGTNNVKAVERFMMTSSEISSFDGLFKELGEELGKRFARVEFLLNISDEADRTKYLNTSNQEVISKAVLAVIDSNQHEDIVDVVSEKSRENHNKQSYYDGLFDKNIELILGLKGQNKKHIGLIAISAKKSGMAFSIEEIKYFESLIPSIVLVIEKIDLLEQEKKFSEKLQIEVKKQTWQLQETLRKERDMLDILGHELRTPMSIARNAISLIKSNIEKDTLDDEKLNKYVDMADENIRRETKLLETMLSTTKLDKGDLGLDLEKVDLNDVIDDSLEGLKKKATDKGLEIMYDPKEQIYIYVDRSRIQEVVDNLIDNAVKYTEKGHVKIKISVENGKSLVEISDTGIGIPEGDLPNLGRKFFRVDTYLKGDAHAPSMDIIRPGGTGLGLYVTTNLVRAMDGTFNVKSKVDVGSTFTLTFPLFDGQAVKTVQKDITKLDKIADYKKRLAK